MTIFRQSSVGTDINVRLLEYIQVLLCQIL